MKQDAKGWRLPGVDYTGGDMVTPHAGVELAAGTQIPGGVVLNYGVTLSSFTLEPGSVLPVTAALAQPLTLPAGAILSAAVFNADGSVALAAGTAGAASHAGGGHETGRRLAVTAMTFLATTEWPAGIAAQPAERPLWFQPADAGAQRHPAARRFRPAPTSSSIPAWSTWTCVRSSTTRRGQVWAVAPMLPEGSQSWSMRLVGGADLDGADTRATQYGVKRGNLVLADNHYGMYGFDAPGFLWTQQGADDIGMPWLAGTVIDEQFIIDNFGYPSAALMCRTCPTTARPRIPRIIWRLPRPRASACCAPAPATWTCWPAATAHAFAVRRLYRRRLVGRHPGRRPVQPAAPEGPGRHGDERSQPGLRALRQRRRAKRLPRLVSGRRRQRPCAPAPT